MKIFFIASADSIHSFKWVNYFAQMGHDVHWASLEPLIFNGKMENIRFYQMKSQEKIFPLSLFIDALRIRCLVRKIKPDIIHAHYAGRNGFLGALTFFHPFVLTAWGSDILISAKSKTKGVAIKFALKKADLITCDAEHMRKAMMELGILSSKINIIYFGIDTKKFCPAQKDTELKKKLRIFDFPAVISSRGLESIYNIETLIEAIPIISKELPETKFIIAGKGSEEKKLKELAKILKVSEKIRFVGWVPNDDLPSYLGTADVYVSTALSDAGIAGSTAEAMACGLPVVITNTGENEKWVKNGEGGYLIPVKNPEILAEKIICLLKNENLRKKFGQINRKIIEERNNYYQEMEKMENIYKELIKK